MPTQALRITGLLLLTLWLGSPAAQAEMRDYTFSGAEGGLFGQPVGISLSGGFSLDTDASASVTTNASYSTWTYSVFTAPNQTISGALGGWTFSGLIDAVWVADGPEFLGPGQDNFAPDHWIVHATVNGPTSGGLTPSRFSLFYYTSAAGLNGAGNLPPADPLSNANLDDFQFNLQFLDENLAEVDLSGRLFTIQSVPEPSTFALVLLGLAGLLAARRRC
jgi:hypothetical protein